MKLPHDTHALSRLRAALETSGAAAHGGRLSVRRPTGWAALDEATGGGLIEGALNEICLEHPGIGALEALLEAFRPPAGERFRAWVHPSRLPYPPALAQRGFDLDRWLVIRPDSSGDHLWAVDIILRCGLCDGLVTYLDRACDRTLRRLQLAAQEGGALALVFRPGSAARESSPAALRLLARPRPAARPRLRQLVLEVIKCRGRPFAPPVLLEWDLDALDEPTLSRSLAGAMGEGPLDERAPLPARARRA